MLPKATGGEMGQFPEAVLSTSAESDDSKMTEANGGSSSESRVTSPGEWCCSASVDGDVS